MNMSSKKIHIAISARAMSLAYGGVREYVSSIICELMRIAHDHKITIYYDNPRFIGTHPEANEVYIAAPHKFVWDHWLLPRHLAQDKPDIVWFPHNVSALGVDLPSVVSVMDLLYFRMPEFPVREYAWLDTFYMRTFIPRSLRQARRIMVISNWTARDVNRLLGIPYEKLQTIYLAPGSGFERLPEQICTAVREKYGIDRPFFFYAGTLTARKNVRVLIDAFGQVSNNLPHDLIITGGSGFIEIPFDDLVAKYKLNGRVKRLGIIPKLDLVALYNTAEAFVFPSRYEGFGIPPLEAFACGCPVISSCATSLAEVVGDAALTFDPSDSIGLAAHLELVSKDSAIRSKLVQSGYERVKQFSYARAAQELLELLKEAAP
jgi:glycosyltransferase involved in cell wall biosynthesis